MKQLQKALQTNDKYIAELEQKQREKENASTKNLMSRNMNFFKNVSPTNNSSSTASCNFASSSASNLGRVALKLTLTG